MAGASADSAPAFSIRRETPAGKARILNPEAVSTKVDPDFLPVNLPLAILGSFYCSNVPGNCRFDQINHPRRQSC